MFDMNSEAAGVKKHWDLNTSWFLKVHLPLHQESGIKASTASMRCSARLYCA